MSASLSRRIRRIHLRRVGGIHIFYLNDNGVLEETPNRNSLAKEEQALRKAWKVKRIRLRAEGKMK